MRSGSSGPLATLLLFVPLVAVPMLAVFGVPQFAPVVASPGDETSVDFGSSVIVGDSAEYPADNPLDPFSSSDSENDLQPPADAFDEQRSGWSDPFHHPEPTARFEPRSSASRATGKDWSPPPSALGDWKTGGLASDADRPDAPGNRIRANFDTQSQTVAGNGALASAETAGGRGLTGETDPAFNPFTAGSSSPRHPDVFPPIRGSLRAKESADASADDRAEAPFERFVKQEFLRDGNTQVRNAAGESADAERPLTWRSAVQRLNALGIRHFQLEPGAGEDFHFSCSFTPGDNPRITHRFEAEATEPLSAVQKVLAQVEHWLESRR